MNRVNMNSVTVIHTIECKEGLTSICYLQKMVRECVNEKTIETYPVLVSVYYLYL